MLGTRSRGDNVKPAIPAGPIGSTVLIERVACPVKVREERAVGSIRDRVPVGQTVDDVGLVCNVCPERHDPASTFAGIIDDTVGYPAVIFIGYGKDTMMPGPARHVESRAQIMDPAVRLGKIDDMSVTV